MEQTPVDQTICPPGSNSIRLPRTYYCITTMLPVDVIDKKTGKPVLDPETKQPIQYLNQDGTVKNFKHYFAGVELYTEVPKTWGNVWNIRKQSCQIWTTKKRAKAFIPKLNLDGCEVEEITLVPEIEKGQRPDKYDPEDWTMLN